MTTTLAIGIACAVVLVASVVVFVSYARKKLLEYFPNDPD